MRRLVIALLGIVCAACNDAVAPASGVAVVRIVPESLELIEGGSARVSVAMFDVRGHALDGVALHWSSSDPGVARADTGVVMAIAEGVATLTASAGGRSATLSVTVLPLVSEIKVVPAGVELHFLDSLQLIAELRDAKGNVATGRLPVSWASSDQFAVSISASGMIRALKPSSAQITATVGSRSATATVAIVDDPARDVADLWDWSQRTEERSVSGSGLLVCVDSGTFALTQSGSTLAGAGVHTGGCDGPLPQGSAPAGVSGETRGAALRLDSHGCSYLASLSQAADRLTGSVRCGSATGTWEARRHEQVATIVVAPNTVHTVTGAQVKLEPILRSAGGQRLFFRTTTWTSDAPAVASVAESGVLTAGGAGTTHVRATSGDVSGLAFVAVEQFRVRAVAAGYMSCALTDAAAVFCWGYGAPWPVRIERLPPVTAISVGEAMGCALATTGDAYCWWVTGEAQRVDSPVLFRSIAAAGRHACGLTDAGAAYCWGQNDAGQLGVASSAGSQSAVRVQGAIAFDQISAMDDHTCGVVSNGDVYCWGSNRGGELGNGTHEASAAPVRVMTDQKFARVIAGALHTCALTGTGSAYCWGFNRDGAIGTGDKVDRLVPAAVTGTEAFASLAAGGWNDDDAETAYLPLAFTCGLKADGVAMCWGNNDYGQLGQPAGSAQANPRAVSTDVSFTALAAGWGHTCGLATDGILYCWGTNSSGELGDGTSTSTSTPARVIGQP